MDSPDSVTATFSKAVALESSCDSPTLSSVG